MSDVILCSVKKLRLKPWNSLEEGGQTITSNYDDVRARLTDGTLEPEAAFVEFDQMWQGQMRATRIADAERMVRMFEASTQEAREFRDLLLTSARTLKGKSS